MVWIQFVVCLAIIIVAGTRLARYGDLIAEKTGLGRVWIGVVLLATVTSLPELTTGISSVALVDNPNLTIGDLFGASLLNLGIIAVIDLFHRKGPILSYMSNGIVLSTMLSLFIIAAAGTFIFLAQNLLTVALFGRVGIFSIVLFLLFLLAQYMIFRFQSVESEKKPETEIQVSSKDVMSLRRAVLYFVIAALVVAGAGTWLASIGDQISHATGLSAAFVGTLFLAISTTAPEVTVSISAARLGALEMAVGNIVGSNLFNIGVIIFIDDLFYAPGPVLQGVSADHIITALFAVLMSSVVIIGIVFRPRRWLPNWVGADTTVLALLYLGAIITLYLLGRPA